MRLHKFIILFFLIMTMLIGCGRQLVKPGAVFEFEDNYENITIKVFPVNIIRGEAAVLSIETAESLAGKLIESGIGGCESANRPLPAPLDWKGGGKKYLRERAGWIQRYLNNNPPPADYALYCEIHFRNNGGIDAGRFYLWDKRTGSTAADRIKFGGKSSKLSEVEAVDECLELIIKRLK